MNFISRKLGQQKRILNLVLKEVRDLRALNCNEYSYLLLGKTNIKRLAGAVAGDFPTYYEGEECHY
jgi:hypothetical protein